MSAIMNPAAAGASKPGGVDKQIQFNDNGAFQGDNGLLYDKATGGLLIGGNATSRIAIGTNPAQTGQIRLANQSSIFARNAANGADINAMSVWSDNKVYAGSDTNDAGLVLRSATDIAAMRGITFPSTQVSSTGPTTLDDYREGTWTPTISAVGGASGQSYSQQRGDFVKFGRLVLVSFTVTLTAKGTLSGNLRINGLPFFATGFSVQYSWGGVGVFLNLTRLVGSLSFSAVNGSTQLATSFAPQDQYGYTNWELDGTSLQDNTEFRGTVPYVALN